nr:MAG TPA: hypothetical protein [Caudoviricetes sp.]
MIPPTMLIIVPMTTPAKAIHAVSTIVPSADSIIVSAYFITATPRMQAAGRSF